MNFNIIRLVALSVVSVLSLIVLGLSAHSIYVTTNIYSAYFTFAAMSVATAVLTLVTLPVMLVIETMRNGAFTSMIVLELVWLGILWVLWLASAALSAELGQGLLSGCDYYYNEVSQVCNETKAIEAFNFLNWLILMAYWILVLTFSIISANKGHKRVWYGSVAEIQSTPVAGSEKPHNDFAPGVAPATNASYPPVVQPHPQGQQQSGWVAQPAAHGHQPSYSPQV